MEDHRIGAGGKWVKGGKREKIRDGQQQHNNKVTLTRRVAGTENYYPSRSMNLYVLIPQMEGISSLSKFRAFAQISMGMVGEGREAEDYSGYFVCFL